MIFGLDWRFSLYGEYFFYISTCENYREIIEKRRKGGSPKRLILRNGVNIELIKNSPFDLMIFREIWQHKEYVKRIKNSPEVVVDIGAHIGFFSLQAATLWPRAKIYAYEPESKNFDVLCKNIQNNNLTQITLYNEAISGQEGYIDFYVNDQAESHSVYQMPWTGKTLKLSKVKAITLREAVGRIPGGQIDFLKMDCEGSEFEIIKTSLDILKSKVHRIALEYHSYPNRDLKQDIVKPLQAGGFAVYEKMFTANLGLIYAEKKTTHASD